MRTLAIAVLAGLAWGLTGVGHAQTTLVPIISWQEIEAHTIGAPPVVALDWVGGSDLKRQAHMETWRAQLIVDASGAVEHARIEDGPESNREEALAALRAVKFRPFEREGRSVRAGLPFTIQGRARDYSGPEDRTFPAAIDLSDVRIRLSRSACLGACPAYELEITGDGAVSYRAEANTLIPGERHWTIPQDRVRAILEVFRRADYFRLEGYYIVPATDLPVYITGLEIGSRKKFVFDYGSVFGGAIASVVFPRSEGYVPAPAVVGEVEDAIDQLSRAEAMIRGSADTVPALRAERFDFRSTEAAAAVNFLIGRCNIAIARAFIAEGASPAATAERTPILYAPRCGDLAFVRDLIAGGALTSPGVADAFLIESAATGSPDMVGEALRHSRAVNRTNEYGQTPLFYAASVREPNPDEPRPARFDRAATISALLAAGADARLLDRQGNSVLHNVRDGPSARLLLRAGANPKAVNARGQTALFSQLSGDVVRLLLQAQVDPNVRDTSGQTALYSAHSADAARALVAGGASLTVVDPGGNTPLEGCNNEDVALALVELGSPIPTGARFDALMRRASPHWRRLMQALQARAASTTQAPAPQ